MTSDISRPEPGSAAAATTVDGSGVGVRRRSWPCSLVLGRSLWYALWNAITVRVTRHRVTTPSHDIVTRYTAGTTYVTSPTTPDPLATQVGEVSSGEHMWHSKAPLSEDFPVSQVAQEVWRSVALNRPGSQGMHAIMPPTGEYSPATQEWQVSDPYTPLYLPGVQASHVAAPALYVDHPGAQSTHSTPPTPE